MKSQIGITSFHLRVIAVITMIIDHIGTVFFPGIAIFKIIGRVSFPLFAFLIVEGSFHSRDIKAYMNRLLACALISEIPFNLAFRRSLFSFGSSNVLFTLYAGLLMIELIKRYHESNITWLKLLCIALVIQFIGGDYLIFGILTVIIFYTYRDEFYKICISLCLLYTTLMGGLQTYALFALLILYFYNGSEGRKIGRFFYLVYPVHLVLIYLVYVRFY